MDAYSDLHDLKNLGRTTVQWLNAIGVHSRADLETKGVVTAYQAMRARGFRATRVALYSLHGALTDTPWRALSEETKRTLIVEASEDLDHEIYGHAVN